MKWPSLATQIVIGLIVGVVVGILLGERATVLKPLGSGFMSLLRMVIVPLVACSLVVAIAGLREWGLFGRMGIRTALFSLVTLTLSISMALAIGSTLGPGKGFDRTDQAEAGPSSPPEPTPKPSLAETILAIIPSNMVGALASGSMLQVLFVAIICGLATARLAPEHQGPIVELLRSVTKVVAVIVGWIMKLAPLGVFGLVAAEVGRSGLAGVGRLAFYAAVVLLALAAQVGLVYIPVVLTLVRWRLARLARAIRPPLLITFGTCSTAAALPVSMRVTSELGFSDRVTSFVLPLGTALGRDGSAAYQVISVLFIANAAGVHLSPWQLVTLAVTVMLAALAVASVPAASFVNLTIVLAALGLPVTDAILVLGVERPLDMVRSSVNLMGQLTCAAFVATGDSAAEPPEETVSC